MKRRSAGGAVGFAVMLSVQGAHGYSCDSDSINDMSLQVLPDHRHTAPLNTRVRVLAMYGWERFVIQKIIVKAKHGPTVQGTTRPLAKAGINGYEFTPAAPLAPSTPYEVVITARDDFERDEEKSKHPLRRTVGAFTTGTTKDETAPVGAAVIEGALLAVDLRTDAKNHYFPSALFTVGAVSDDTTPSEALLYAVYPGEPNAPDHPIDYTKPPRAYFPAVRDERGGHEVIMFEQADPCAGWGYSYPKQIKALFDAEGLPKTKPRPMGSWKVGLRAVDLAGNSGAPAEITLDLSQILDATRASDSRTTCDEATEKAFVRGLPRGDSVPINTRVYIWDADLADGYFHLSDATYSLVDKQGKPVAVKEQRLGLGSVAVIELTPQAALRAGATYRVIDKEGKSITSFQTGNATDSAAPTGQLAQSPTVSGRLATLDAAGVVDAGAPTAPSLFGIWSPRRGDHIDYNDPPQTYVLAQKGRLSFGERALCTVWNYTFPYERKSLRLGILPVDLAGNRGEPREISLDIRRMRSRARPKN